MPPRRKPKTAPPARVADRIGDLPDSILHHLLSFLPIQAAVQTCVLARRWRHLWRSTTGLRIVVYDDKHFEFQRLRKFVEHLLILRERTELETVEIKLGEGMNINHIDEPCVNLWIRFAVMCKVRVLTLQISDMYLYLDDLPLVSRHLRTLDLYGVALQKNSLDFASCPALEDLEMNTCEILVDKISSRSLKHFSIDSCDLNCRIRVSTPGLVSLKLVAIYGKTPILENMALLETAYVNLTRGSKDLCLNYDSGVFCGSNSNACKKCVAYNDGSSECVLLSGISSAKHLELLSESRKFIFVRDLEHCPTFNKLKTLLLNEYWCEAPDLDPLACILKNSPVLEKLTLQLFSKGPNHEVEIKGSCSSMDGPSAIPEHLNTVEVKCNVVDKRILKVLKFLSGLNIRFSFE